MTGYTGRDGGADMKQTTPEEGERTNSAGPAGAMAAECQKLRSGLWLTICQLVSKPNTAADQNCRYQHRGV
jgi:hypothetical protein